jgi:hypothetical protein
MLIYERVPIEKVQIGERVRVEVNRVEIVARVVACDSEQGTLHVTPCAYVISSRGRSSMRRCPLACLSDVCVVRAGDKEIKVLRPLGFKLSGAAPLTWEEISELEPQVLVLLDQIKSERPTMRNFLGIWLTYLEQFSALVGLRREDATNPPLRSQTTYKTVYEKLVNNFGNSE